MNNLSSLITIHVMFVPYTHNELELAILCVNLLNYNIEYSISGGGGGGGGVVLGIVIWMGIQSRIYQPWIWEKKMTLGVQLL